MSYSITIILFWQGRLSHELFEVNDGAGSGLRVKANYNLTKCLSHVLTL